MKKKLLIICSFSLFGFMAKAQTDTLLFENFDVDPTAGYATFNSGNDLGWVDFDADALPDANGRPQNWYYSPTGFADVDSTDGCIFSSSWLTNVTPPNRNWLMTPPINLSNTLGATLSWASAPRQTPSYVDGYIILVSTTDNLETSFTDTIFQAAQYLTGSGADFSTYTFSPGFVHGQDGTYIQFDADSSQFIGELRPFSASIAQYAGQTIYIAFLHNSDDDNLIALDDILVTATLTGVKETADNLSLNLYPNPANDKLNLSYSVTVPSNVVATVYDVKGEMVFTVTKEMQLPGNQKLNINTSNLSNGLYNVVLNVGGIQFSKRFVKN